jgi:hypothetical protein
MMRRYDRVEMTYDLHKKKTRDYLMVDRVQTFINVARRTPEDRVKINVFPALLVNHPTLFAI